MDEQENLSKENDSLAIGSKPLVVGEPVVNVPDEDAASSVISEKDEDLTQPIAQSDAKTIVIPDEYADDPVARKRIEHGLPPVPTGNSGNLTNISGDLSGSTSGPIRNTGKPAFSQERRARKEAEDRIREAKRSARIKLIRRISIAVVALVVAGLLAGFWWMRWGATNDKETIQGKWRISGSDAVITITDECIILTDEVSYDYEIDSDSKTIVFAFGSLNGEGRYRIALDGNKLALIDGKYDWFGTLIADMPWMTEAFIAELSGSPSKSPSLGENGKLLERVN